MEILDDFNPTTNQIGLCGLLIPLGNTELNECLESRWMTLQKGSVLYIQVVWKLKIPRNIRIFVGQLHDMLRTREQIPS